MPKDRSYGDRGTGYTPRLEHKFGRGSKWCKRWVIIQPLFKSINYTYADVVLER